MEEEGFDHSPSIDEFLWSFHKTHLPTPALDNVAEERGLTGNMIPLKLAPNIGKKKKEVIRARGSDYSFPLRYGPGGQK